MLSSAADAADAVAPLGPETNPTVLLFLSVGIAFMAFAVGRYVSGMTSVKEWKLLRGGASYLMGNFLMAVLTVIGTIVVLFSKKPDFMGTLAVVFPAITFLVGLEFLVTFLLGAYRPRKKGEIGRPAFDSRVLGMLTAPKSLGSIISETTASTPRKFYHCCGK